MASEVKSQSPLSSLLSRSAGGESKAQAKAPAPKPAAAPAGPSFAEALAKSGPQGQEAKMAPKPEPAKAPPPARPAKAERPAPPPASARAEAGKPRAPKPPPSAAEDEAARGGDDAKASRRAKAKRDGTTEPEDQAGAAAEASAGAVGVAGAAHAEGSKVGRQGLTTLRQFATSHKAAIDNAPVVAFLTGHLEKLSSADIPALVSDNRFLAGALGEADLSAFMGKAMTVGELFEALDLPPAVRQDAERLGIDLAQMVTPQDLFKAFGLDPQRVMSELKLLKDNLGLSGLGDYMRRAQTLGAKDPLRQDLALGEKLDPRAPPTAGDWSKGKAAQQAGMDIEAATMASAQGRREPGRGTPSAPSFKLSQPGAGMMETSPDSLRDGALAMDPAMMQAGLWAQAAGLGQLPVGGPPELGLANGMSGIAGVSARSGLASLDPSVAAVGALSLEEGVGQLPREALSLQDPALQGALASPEALAGGPAPTLHRATFDAWQTMGERLKESDTVRLTEGREAEASLLGSEELLPALGERPLGRSVTAFSPETLKATEPKVLREAPSLTEILERPVVEGSRIVGEPRAARETTEARWESPSLAPSFASPPALSVKDPLAPKPENAVRLEDLRLAAPPLDGRLAAGLAGGGEFGRGDSQSSERGKEDGSLMAGGRADLAGLGEGRASAPQASGFEAAVQSPEPAMTPEQRAQAVQQVIDRTTAIVRDGGGTMRLDLASPELGNLELVVNLVEDRVDLRVLASSDRVREAMAADLTQLRDALAVQNIQLGQVDVGVAGRNPNGFAGFGGGMPFERRPGQPEGWAPPPSRAAVRESATAGVDRLRRAQLTPVAPADLQNGVGRIALRV